MGLRKLYNRTLDFLRDPAIKGVRDLLIIISIVSAAIVGLVALVQSQIPAFQDWLTDTFIIERWMYLLAFLGMMFLISIVVVQWRALLLLTPDEVSESDDESDFKPVHGVLWRWPPPANRRDTRWNPKCPEHRVTMHVYKEDVYPEDANTSEEAEMESRYFFECRGNEKGDDGHIEEGPFELDCYRFSLRSDVYDRIMGKRRLSGN